MERGIGKKSAVHMGRKGGGIKEKNAVHLNFQKGQYIRWVKIKEREHRQYI